MSRRGLYLCLVLAAVSACSDDDGSSQTTGENTASDAAAREHDTGDASTSAGDAGASASDAGENENSDTVSVTIEHGELLRAGSPEEVEIRALGVHAVEGLRTALAELGRDVPPWQLDQVLWERGARPRYKAEPRHRARSVFY